MAANKTKFPNGNQVAFLGSSESTGKKDVKGSVQIIDLTLTDTKYKIYPWGANNKLPIERLSLLRSNGDSMNLLGARADFLFGGGFGFFKMEKDAKGQLIRQPYMEGKVKESLAQLDLNYVVNQMFVSLTETGNMLVRKKMVAGMPILEWVDVTTMRLVVSDSLLHKVAILSPDWGDDMSVKKNSVVIPLIQPSDSGEGHIHLRPPQSGQVYYGFPQWWSEETVEWVEIMNVVSRQLKQAVKSNNNVSHITRVGEDYIKKMVSEPSESELDNDEYDYEKELDKARDKFYANVEKYLLTGERKVLIDECGYDSSGKMTPNIEISEVKRSLNSKEFVEAYQAALNGFANASGILSGLAGVDTGGKLGGSGSELKVAANFQQTFRTVRERLMVIRMIDKIYRGPLQLPGDVFPGFFDNVLVNDNADKTGVSDSATEQTTK